MKRLMIAYSGTIAHLRFLLNGGMPDDEGNCAGCGQPRNNAEEGLCEECKIAALNI